MMNARQLALSLAVCLQSVAPTAIAQTLPPAMHAEVAARSPESVASSPANPAQPVRHADPVPTAPEPASAPNNAPTMRMFRGHPEDDVLREMATRPVLRVIERFNSSTLVFHCDLGDGIEMAFKPARQGEHDWWIHEVAGYELARALGMEGRVPPAVARRVPVSALDGFLREANLEVNRDGTVDGAAIFWMPVLRRTNLHTAESRDQWNPWLDPRREIPAEHRVRATQIAALIAFDYLQANFDRWNSANVPQDEHDDLIFRDNNRGWYIENLVRLDRGGIDGFRRIPASLLTAIERTPAAALARRTVQATPRILGERQLEQYELRRRALLAKVAELIAEHGRERVVIDDSAAPIARPPSPPEAAASASSSEDGARRRRRRRRHHDDTETAAPASRHHRRRHHDDSTPGDTERTSERHRRHRRHRHE
jgi:hypothetical protein